MIVDLHCHFPMHLLVQQPKNEALEKMVRVRRRPRWVDKLRAWVLALAARLLNYRRFDDRWRVSFDGLRKGGVRVVLSVLYQPFAEMDLDEWYGAKPEDGYHADLIEQLEAVERALAREDPDNQHHVIVKRASDLEDAIDSGRVAFLHCVEGGFHLGGTVEAVQRNVAELAGRGVAYITLAHLFWRRVATNAPALPFLSDRVYNLIFRQPHGAGLTDLGRAAVRAMYEQRILVDVSHMRQDAVDATFALLDELDREHGADPKDFPVIASHSAFRVGSQAYNLTPETVERIAARDGVIGLILAQHQLNDGIRCRKTKTLDETMEVLARHIEAIHGVTGSYDHIALGSDFDGFIKPTTGGLEYAADLALLREPFTERYPADAESMLSRNGVRVLRRVLQDRTG